MKCEVLLQPSSGRWVAVLELGFDQNGKRSRRRVTGKTKREAETKLKAELVKRDAGMSLADGQTKLADWLEKWLVEILPDGAKPKSANTLTAHAWVVRKRLVPGLGHLRLCDLTPDHVERFLIGKSADGMAKGSLIKFRSTLSMALRQAERRGYVLRNAASLVDIPPAHATERKALTGDQAKALLSACEGDPIDALVTTGIMLGRRPRELLGLS